MTQSSSSTAAAACDSSSNGSLRNRRSEQPLVTLKARPIISNDDGSGLLSKAPFGNDSIEFELYESSCVELRGPSGRGKTTIANVLTGIDSDTAYQKHLLQTKLHLDIQCEWSSEIPIKERCGVLFQQTTLLDELTVAGNLAVALKLHDDVFPTELERDLRIKQLLDTVGLDYAKDANKLPTELSGGMGRRVCLALQLAQRKRVIVLDEPFTGLDYETAISIAKELVRLRKTQNTALVLISHEPHLSKLVMAGCDDNDNDNDDSSLNKNNRIIELIPPKTNTNTASTTATATKERPNLFGTCFLDQFIDKLMDYTLWSMPLIVMAFVACGLAISMLSADLLQRLDVSTKVLDLVDKEVRPLIKFMTGEEPNTLQMMGIRFKVNSMLDRTVPPAKAKLFAIGITKLFVLEIGPLLTALLLCGRIGGSYAGKVGTMQATNQNKLLKVLGIDPRRWTLYPSLLGASIASPLLTITGTMLALVLGGYIASTYKIIHEDTNYWTDVKESIFPPLRLHSFEHCWTKNSSTTDDVDVDDTASSTNDLVTILYSMLSVIGGAMIGTNSEPLNLRVTYDTTTTTVESVSSSLLLSYSWIVPTMIELMTYPPIYHVLKSLIFIWIIIGVAEFVSRRRPNLTPKGVPSVITVSVVVSGLFVIFADWAFSQLWLLRE